MADRDFDSAPDLLEEFEQANRHDNPRDSLGIDAANWEFTEDHEPSAKHFTLDFTPGGTLEQEVHTQLDNQERAAIRAAQDRRNSPRHEWDELLDRQFERDEREFER